ncbi:MAG: pyridoxamine 5'-phosphate oxidase family protein [Mycolicibacterium sp.]|uniref:pyridoxamine 5'-phosphate oxidase family protein n=1 Tax=Mycolicibacterium sp. TaxID=2320850 RepID=UPI003D12BE12
MTNENVGKLGDVLRALDHIMLTTHDQSGHVVGRPMVLRVDHFDGSLFLIAPRDSRVVANIRANPEVNIAYTGPKTSLSVAGRATVSPNRDQVAARWHRGLDSWLPGGADSAALIEITVDEARFWTYTGEQHSPLPIRGEMRQIDVADFV